MPSSTSPITGHPVFAAELFQEIIAQYVEILNDERDRQFLRGVPSIRPHLITLSLVCRLFRNLTRPYYFNEIELTHESLVEGNGIVGKLGGLLRREPYIAKGIRNLRCILTSGEDIPSAESLTRTLELPYVRSLTLYSRPRPTLLLSGQASSLPSTVSTVTGLPSVIEKFLFAGSLTKLVLHRCISFPSIVLLSLPLLKFLDLHDTDIISTPEQGGTPAVQLPMPAMKKMAVQRSKMPFSLLTRYPDLEFLEVSIHYTTNMPTHADSTQVQERLFPSLKRLYLSCSGDSRFRLFLDNSPILEGLTLYGVPLDNAPVTTTIELPELKHLDIIWDSGDTLGQSPEEFVSSLRCSSLTTLRMHLNLRYIDLDSNPEEADQIQRTVENVVRRLAELATTEQSRSIRFPDLSEIAFTVTLRQSFGDRKPIHQSFDPKWYHPERFSGVLYRILKMARYDSRLATDFYGHVDIQP
ncbi:hypothetical protein CVT24_006572 [Panaeolus cyanescens]|uniref:F-box domain-containing protein n=1 Tax=Panaeolus cyanescens TaxID=181874 RepID=A0A409WC68_9AGAR|nr:hypothetical protein CVT24_006572 [Panaeolus cyanescens]